MLVDIFKFVIGFGRGRYGVIGGITDLGLTGISKFYTHFWAAYPFLGRFASRLLC